MHLHIHSKKNPAGDLLNLKVGHKLLGSEVSENTQESYPDREGLQKNISQSTLQWQGAASLR